MFMESSQSKGEAFAVSVARVVGSIWFPIMMIFLITAWIVINVAFRPFEPYPTLMVAGLACGLASMSALQGPLILLAQRRGAERDRAREREMIHLLERIEGDIHTLREMQAEITRSARLGPGASKGQ